MIKECIILAGGLGTRLREAVPDLPKCMAPVNGRAFLFYVINYLRSQGIEKFIFSLGYKHELVETYLQSEFSTLDYQCLIEKEPLGTGGAILASCYKASEQTVLVVNGDTIFKADIENAFTDHIKHDSDCTLLLKPMENFERYGVVELNEDDSVASFKEKQSYAKGTINGGVYIIDVRSFLSRALPERFSFETDILEKEYPQCQLFACPDDGYFIDIGIPEDYHKAEIDFKVFFG